MRGTDRRTFIKLLGAPAMLAAMPDSIARAVAIPANHKTGTIHDVEHIVILMQENRSFDHYFGTMRGVRGFADPRAVRLPSGKSVWHQPNGAGELLPFRPDVVDVGMDFLPDPPHDWTTGHDAWNEGKYDQWIANKGTTTMAYHTRHDLPYQFALADAFTVCDAYHCAIMGPTDPNRYHMWTGWLGNDGSGGGPVITNAEAGYDWSTFPERLQAAGISWKIYQDIGVGLDAAGYWGWTGDMPYIGNYGDNSLLYFHQYQNALAGTPLADRARTGTDALAHGMDPASLLAIFRDDVEHNRLPQVSWIVAPEAYTEHPNWAPDFGAWYVSQFVEILASNPDLFGKTVLFINYDEDGGFFDHVVSPTPPASPAQGLSTVSTINEIFPGAPGFPGGPYGLGVRVPMIIVSPWTKGGYVNSQVFDHTSLIRFIESRFASSYPDIVEPNITPWRRAVAGDLTSAFDFAHPNGGPKVLLPVTDAFEPQDFETHPDNEPVPPAHQSLPAQEPGVKPARALPYELDARAHVNTADGSVRLDFLNTGSAAGVFHVRSANTAQSPRSYTVEPGLQLSDAWPVTAAGAQSYDLSVYGPNGFFRWFVGGVAAGRARPGVTLEYDPQTLGLTLTIVNPGAAGMDVQVLDKYSGKSVQDQLSANGSMTRRWTVAPTHGWYDLVVTCSGDAGFMYELAGHLENGRDSISDPAMGGLI
jgi:phospholipase C